jgi:hypothetical protein
MSYHFFCRIALLLFVIIPKIIFGQLNIKVGYTGGFTKAPELNTIVSDFNETFVSKYNGKLGDALDEIRSLHGLEIGLRYRMGGVGMELSWHNMSDKSDVFGTLNSGINFQDKWFTSLTEYSFGLENYIGKLGYGASIGYRTVRIKTDIAGAPRKKQSVTTESGFASKFYLLFQYPGEKVGIAFKPYVQVPLKNIDISSFDQELNVQLNESYISSKPLEERFFIYGISIVLYNGKQ